MSAIPISCPPETIVRAIHDLGDLDTRVFFRFEGTAYLAPENAASEHANIRLPDGRLLKGVYVGEIFKTFVQIQVITEPDSTVLEAVLHSGKSGGAPEGAVN